MEWEAWEVEWEIWEVWEVEWEAWEVAAIGALRQIIGCLAIPKVGAQVEQEVKEGPANKEWEDKVHNGMQDNSQAWEEWDPWDRDSWEVWDQWEDLKGIRKIANQLQMEVRFNSISIKEYIDRIYRIKES